jgi:anaerobic selenocysteine-containing dehydrogenase
VNKGQLCPKGEAALESIYHPDRLTHPLKRKNGDFVSITWDQALDEISEKLLKLKKEFGPEVLGVFSGSIGVENLEIAGLTQRLMAAFGSPNFFSVESVCYRMRIRSRQITFGKYPTEELDSNLYILWGHNPEESDLPLKLAMEENIDRGARLIVIDPKRIPLADKADMYLGIRPGTDGALALALMNVIINEGLYDREFIEKHTTGFDELVSYIPPYTPQWAEEITWIPAERIRELARVLATTRGAGIYQGTNTQDQTINGTQNSRAFSILQTITGNINVPGAWTISPRLKIGNTTLPVQGKPLGVDQYPLFYELWGRKSPYGIVSMVPEAIPDKLKAFIVEGGNPLLSMPDSKAFEQAFKKLDLLVVQDLFMTRTAELAHYVLPACSHLEKWGLAYTYNVVHCLPYLMLRKKCIEPYHESWSEWRFFTELASRMGMGDKFPWQSEEELVSYELEPTRMSFDYLLNTKPEGDYYQEKDYSIPEGTFKTPSGKIEIYSSTLKEYGFDPLPSYQEPAKSPRRSDKEFLQKYPLVLSTGNRKMSFTHGQHRNVRTLIEETPYPLAEISLKTAQDFALKDNEEVVIETTTGAVQMRAKIEERVMDGVVLLPHGWPDDANVNILVDAKCREPIMGYPDMKSLMCTLKKASGHSRSV